MGIKFTTYGLPGVYNPTPFTLVDGQGSALSVDEHGRVILSDETVFAAEYPLNIPSYDHVSMALSAGDTTETYTFKTGGSGGSTVATVVVVYTNNTRSVLSSVTKT